MLSDRADLTSTTKDALAVYVVFNAAEWALLWQASIADGAPSIKDWIMAEVRIRLKGIVSTVGLVPDSDDEYNARTMGTFPPDDLEPMRFKTEILRPGPSERGSDDAT